MIRFYDTAIPISMMTFFQKMAVQADVLPDIIFASIGRTIWKVRPWGGGCGGEGRGGVQGREGRGGMGEGRGEDVGM